MEERESVRFVDQSLAEFQLEKSRGLVLVLPRFIVNKSYIDTFNDI